MSRKTIHEQVAFTIALLLTKLLNVVNFANETIMSKTFLKNIAFRFHRHQRMMNNCRNKHLQILKGVTINAVTVRADKKQLRTGQE